MKGKLIFDLNDQFEAEHFRRCLKATDLALALLRLTEEENQDLRGRVYDALENYNIDLEDIIS